MDIEVNHYIYDIKFRCLKGADDADELDLRDLLYYADSVSDRKECYFFKTIKDRFIIGFLTKWEGAYRAGECFFNIFSMKVDDVRKARLGDIITELRRRIIKNPDENFETTFVISVGEEYEYPLVVAQIYKDIVLNGKVYAPIDFISLFKSKVEDALEKIKFISCESRRSQYFNAVEGNLHLHIDDNNNLVKYIREGHRIVLKDRLTDEEIELKRCSFCYSLKNVKYDECGLKVCGKHEEILHKGIYKLKEEKSELYEENKSLKTKIHKLEKENESLKVENGKLEADNKILKESIRNLQQRIHKLWEKNESLRADKRSLEEENKKLEAENKDLRDSIQKLEKENESLKAENGKLKGDNENLRKRIHKLEEENKKLRAKNRELETAESRRRERGGRRESLLQRTKQFLLNVLHRVNFGQWKCKRHQ